MNRESDTPRCDKFLANTKCKTGRNVTDNFSKRDLAEFARGLEREINALHVLRHSAPESVQMEGVLRALLHPAFETMKRAGIKRMSFEVGSAVIQFAEGGVYTIES